MRTYEKFNQSAFSVFMNSAMGRLFRIVAGVAFLLVGYGYRGHWLGIVSMVWGLVPLSAGAFDLCFISAMLGGPMSGEKIRESQRPHPPAAAHHPS